MSESGFIRFYDLQDYYLLGFKSCLFLNSKNPDSNKRIKNEKY
ncbi:MAG: hypothetical protein U0457_00530 [Candidatus Sericytochromatia bacterium]